MDQEYLNIRTKVFELCEEDDYGSWELWWAVAPEDDALKISSRKKFHLIINDLIKNNMIFSKIKGTDGEFVIVPLSSERLEHEILSADRPDPDRFYWFGTR